MKPDSPTNSSSATFTFTGIDDTDPPWALSFECRLDSTSDLAWVECENPWFYTNLSAGEHTFEVRAIDSQGNIDPTPATYTWLYTALPLGLPPDTFIDRAPPLDSPFFEGFFTFSSNEPDVTFECSLDGAPFAPCGFENPETPVDTGVFLFAGRHIEVPAAFIAGKADWGVYQKPGAFEAMQSKACPRLLACDLVDGAGHWVQQEQAEETSRLLVEFLARTGTA